MKPIDAVRLEVEVPPAEGRFVVSVDAVGSALTAENVTSTWVDITGSCRDISVRRGGARSGVVVALDVGTLTATLVNDYDPMTDDTLTPARTVRLRTVGGQTLFTGQILDVSATYDKAGQWAWPSFVAVDGVHSLVQTKAYGAISGEGYEPWAARIRRLCARAQTPTNPPEA